MRIDSLFGIDSEYSTANSTYGKQEEEENLPLSWKADSVEISDEAKSAYGALIGGTENSDSEENAASDEFSQYLSEAKGQSVSSGDSAEQLEELYEKLEKLQTQLSQLMGSGLPEEAKQASTGAITSQITALQAQIMALTNQASSA